MTMLMLMLMTDMLSNMTYFIFLTSWTDIEVNFLCDVGECHDYIFGEMSLMSVT